MRDLFRSSSQSVKRHPDSPVGIASAFELIHSGLRGFKHPISASNNSSETESPQPADRITPAIFRSYDIAVKIFSYLLPSPRPEEFWEWHEFYYTGSNRSPGRLWDKMQELRALATVNRTFHTNITPILFHTVEIVRRGQLPRLLSLLRDERSRHLRPLITNLHIYDLNTAHLHVPFYLPRPPRAIQPDIWHQLMSPADAALFFPAVRAVNLLAGAPVDSSFLSTLPELRVLRMGRDALPVAEDDDGWPALSIRLDELCIFEDIGMDPHRVHNEKHMLDTRGRVSIRGWLNAPETLVGLSILRIDIARMWQLRDLEIIVNECESLTELHIEFGDEYHRFWEQYDVNGPRACLSNNNLQVLHVYPWKAPWDHRAFLCEVLEDSCLPLLHTVNVSLVNLESDANDYAWKRIWGRGRLCQLPKSVTAGIQHVNVDGGVWGVSRDQKHIDPRELLPEDEMEAVKALVKFMGFQDKRDRVHATVFLHKYTMPPTMFVDERHHRVATVYRTSLEV